MSRKDLGLALSRVGRRAARGAQALLQAAVGDPAALVHEIDRRLLAGQFDFVGRVLTRLEPTELPAEIVLDVLMVTRPATGLLGDARRAFSESALESLRGRLSVEDLAHVERHLR